MREATWCSNNVTGWAPNSAVAVAVVGEDAVAEEVAGAGAEGVRPEPVARPENVDQLKTKINGNHNILC